MIFSLCLNIVLKNEPVFNINAFSNLSVVTLERIAKLFLRQYFVCFCFGKILLMGHMGFVDRDLWSFLSAFSKSSRISILFCFSVCLSACLPRSICHLHISGLFVCLSVCLSVCITLIVCNLQISGLSVCLSVTFIVQVYM